jgi:prophage regulatory protein
MAELPLILRSDEVVRLTGLSRATIWRRVKAHNFPAPVKLGSWHPQSASGWIREEVLAWVENMRHERNESRAT